MTTSTTALAPPTQCPRCGGTTAALDQYCPTCNMPLLTAPTGSIAPQPLFYAAGTAASAPRPRANPLKRLLAPLAPVAYLLLKFKYLFLLLFKSKVALLFISMVVSTWAYAAAWGLGLPAAIGLMALILIHEMGHWLAFRYKKIPAALPVFVPFVGAFVAGKAPVNSLIDMADIALAGPLAGTAASFACLGLSALLGGHLWPYLGLLGLYLNLFNLIPLGFLDGGRIAKAVTLWLWVPGLGLMAYLFVQHQNPLLLAIGALGLWELVSRLRRHKSQAAQPEASQSVALADRLVVGASYFALVALITLTMLHNPAFGWGAL